MKSYINKIKGNVMQRELATTHIIIIDVEAHTNI